MMCGWLQAAVALSDGSGRGRELSRLRISSAASPFPGAGIRLGGGSVTAALAAWRARRGVGLDLTAAPGADALTSKVPLSLPRLTEPVSCEDDGGYTHKLRWERIWGSGPQGHQRQDLPSN